jgi:acyl homoserine lactone synthase
MHQIVCGTLADSAFLRDYAPAMFRLRYHVFHERLRWQVQCRDGCEIDQFDDARSLYMLATPGPGITLGGWRLRPTTCPYMLDTVFPQLLDGQPPPRAPEIWEVSRFAVDDRDDGPDGAAFGFNGVARSLVRAVIRHAVDHGIRQYVMVISVAVERLLANTGMALHRFGPPQKIGRVRSVACWLDIDAHTRHVILGEPAPAMPVAA